MSTGRPAPGENILILELCACQSMGAMRIKKGWEVNPPHPCQNAFPLLPYLHLELPVSLIGTATLSIGIITGVPAKGKEKSTDLAWISPMGPGIII